jgi:phosphoribosyl 1,2-cyclic phosphate phosphodiesterase
MLWYTERMRMILMGTGTSHGIPVIACSCKVCRSHSQKDKRLRCSAYVEQHENDGNTTHLVIDTGPEFRIQALKYHVNKLDAVLLTHSHADHLNGLDDLRIFSHTKSEGASRCGVPVAKYAESPGTGLAVYSNAASLTDVRNRFDYIFKATQTGGGKPKLALVDSALFSAVDPLLVGSVRVIPVPMRHGCMETTGWLLSTTNGNGVTHSIAYLTDCNEIPDSSIALLLESGGIIDHVVIDGLRETSHSTHFSYLEAIACAAKIGGIHTWLTHICHNMNHRDITKYCRLHVNDFPELVKIVKLGGSVLPAYDGLVLKTDR